MNIEVIYKKFLSAGNISTDSRKIKKNDIFWALRGENYNGNDYISTALENGASFAVSDRKKSKSIRNVIYVEDSLIALQSLANYHRKKLKLKLIAITGTNGKTTTKELIAQVLSFKYNIKATQGNFNNHIGVPLTLLTFDRETEFGVVEMGANHPGEIKTLCEIAEPDFGLITNIGKAHLEGFGSFEGLIDTKKEIYDFLENKGTIFINEDNNQLKSLLKNQKKITYGSAKNADYVTSYLSSSPFLKVEVKSNEKYIINSNLIGAYNFENISAAVCIGSYFNVKTKDIKDAIEEYKPINNRSQIITVGNSNIISDAYNANPTSMKQAIDNFNNIEAENKLIIVGDMFELGKFSVSEHEKIIDQLSGLKNTKIEILTAGKLFMNACKTRNATLNIKSFKTTEALIDYIKTVSFSNTWVLIKGSRGMKLETIIQYLNIK